LLAIMLRLLQLQIFEATSQDNFQSTSRSETSHLNPSVRARTAAGNCCCYNDQTWNCKFIHIQQLWERITVYMLSYLASEFTMPASTIARPIMDGGVVRASVALPLPARVFHFCREKLWRPTLIVMVKFCNIYIYIYIYIYWVSVNY
jgi:hypothetical protein